MLVDLISQGITGQAAEDALGRANITVNRNAVPNDPRPPRVTSGLRIGTPAITTRGFKEEETLQLTGWIADILDDLDSGAMTDQIRDQVIGMCQRFPVYER
ncbi:MAG: serine hydroxymethyltransferase, partial [Gammaproteobacteria bacterium]